MNQADSPYNIPRAGFLLAKQQDFTRKSWDVHPLAPSHCCASIFDSSAAAHLQLKAKGAKVARYRWWCLLDGICQILSVRSWEQVSFPWVYLCPILAKQLHSTFSMRGPPSASYTPKPTTKSAWQDPKAKRPADVALKLCILVCQTSGRHLVMPFHLISCQLAGSCQVEKFCYIKLKQQDPWS